MRLYPFMQFEEGITAKCQLIHQVHHIHTFLTQTVQLKCSLIRILRHVLLCVCVRIVRILTIEFLPPIRFPQRSDFLVCLIAHLGYFWRTAFAGTDAFRYIFAIWFLISFLTLSLSCITLPCYSIILTRNITLGNTAPFLRHLHSHLVDEGISLSLNLQVFLSDTANAHIGIDFQFIAEPQLLILALK